MKCEYELRKLLSSWVNTGDRDIDNAAVDVGVEIFRIFYVAHQIWIRDEVDRGDRSQALFLQNQFVELMTAVMSLAVPDYFDKDMEIRDRLLDFKEQHLFAQ